MKLLTRKIGMKDYELDYKFTSKASKRCRNKMVKQLRNKEKKEFANIVLEENVGKSNNRE